MVGDIRNCQSLRGSEVLEIVIVAAAKASTAINTGHDGLRTIPGEG